MNVYPNKFHSLFLRSVTYELFNRMDLVTFLYYTQRPVRCKHKKVSRLQTCPLKKILFTYSQHPLN
jgi:hypothetical protein